MFAQLLAEREAIIEQMVKLSPMYAREYFGVLMGTLESLELLRVL